MKNLIFNLYKSKPLTVIILSALLVRLVSVFFSEGYGMHDDHFLALESPFSWTQGFDRQEWLPQSQENPKATGHNFVYPGLNYLLFSFLQNVGIDNPKIWMFINRLLHALLSLLTVFYGFKIAEKLSDSATAKTIGWMLALFWFMPFFSVRNLVEIVAIPFLMAGTWLLVKNPTTESKWLFFWAGFVMAVAFSFRYQALLYVGGVGLVLLFQRQWLQTILFGFGALISITILQCPIDLYLWGRPFAEFLGYVQYNILHRHNYGVNNYLMYVEVIAGMLIPPLSLFLIWGLFVGWRKKLLLFIPVVLFFAFHTYFPNKQERFIFTIVPMVILLGYMGWVQYIENSGFWKRKTKLLSRFYIFSLIVNTILLIIVSINSSKLSRVNVMYYFYPIRDQVKSILIEDSEKTNATRLPVMYSGKIILTYMISKDTSNSSDTIKKHQYYKRIGSVEFFEKYPNVLQPEFIVFPEGKQLEKRIENVKKVFPNIKQVATIQPSMIDRVARKLNPKNTNETFYIYKLENINY